MSTPLDAQSIEQALTTLPGWAGDTDALTRSYRFADFREALAFIVRIGIEAELANHHPEIVNVYSSITLRLNTHDAGGRVTQKDVALASAIERAYEKAHAH